MSTTALIFANQAQTQELHPVFTKVYQMTVIERTLHALERAGVEKAVLICGDNEAQLRQLLAIKKPPVIAVDYFKKIDDVTFKQADSFLITEPVVVSVDVLKKLKATTEEEKFHAVTTHNSTVAYISKKEWSQSEKERTAQNVGGTQFDMIVDVSTEICTPIHTKTQLKKTKKALIKSLTKSTDGWVSKNLNRPISTSFSRVLAHTSITPNQFTVFTGVIALVTGYFMVMGGYWNWLIAAFLFQLTSVMDGVDGELARLKFKSSDFGQWLDTVVDNLSYIVGLGGLIFGVYRLGYFETSPAVKWSGILAVIFAALALGSLYLYLLRFGKGGTLLNVEYGYQNQTGWYPKMMKVAAAFGKRDLFALLFFILAIFGYLPMALGYVAIMAAAVFGLSVQAHLIAARKAKTEA